jgi:hypothetical protein
MTNDKPLSRRLAYWAGYFYFFAGFAYLVYGAATKSGPFEIVTGWQVRQFGSSNTFTAFLPGFFLLALSVLALLKLLPAGPSVAGSIRAGVSAALSSPAKSLRFSALAAGLPQKRRPVAIRNLRFISLVFVAISTIICAMVEIIGAHGAGAAIPAYTPAQLAAADPDTLPSYVRIVGTTPESNLAFGNRYTIRGRPYLDYYIPRVSAGWTPDKAVTIVEEDQSFPGELPSTEFGMLPEGSADPEGTLVVNGLDSWMPERIAKTGWRPANPVFVITEDADLHGVVPGPDQSHLFFALPFFLLALMCFVSSHRLQARFRREGE